MKKILSILFIMACFLTFIACDSNDETPNQGQEFDTTNPYFVGRVIEIYEDRTLVEVTDTGNGHLVVGDTVLVNTNVEDCPDFDVGDHLRVSFDGKVALSLPAQILGVISIHVTDSNGNQIE